jgi:hypothetical protein
MKESMGLRRLRLSIASLTLFTCVLAFLSVELARAQSPFTFRDVGNETGLFPAAAGIAGHGVGWGDVNGDGWPDLYVATFGGHPYGSKPNQLFLNRKGKFQLDPQPHLRVLGRANGAVFADLDNDGDLDLYTTNHAIDGKPHGQPHYGEPNHLFRNEGGGKFTDVSAASGTCPTGIAARSAAVVDYDGDGLLDLFVGECFFQGGKSRTRLYRNRGGLKFENVTTKVGLPEKLTGFGVAAGDVNGDGWPDLMVGGRHHGNRLFINDGRGSFREVPKSYANFVFEYKDTPDDTACGVCFGDVNRDGRPDIVIGSHFDRPWWTGGVAVRLYLNQGVSDGWPRFIDVTERVGLTRLPMKSPHVEVQDFDNDGWPDIYTSIVKFRGAEPHPVIFRNLGTKSGMPKFKEFALGVNDFPTAEDRKMASVGPFFAKMEREHKIVYTAPGPSCDFDRDGRLDLFLGNWWVKQRSLLLKNESKAGNWIQVAVTGGDGVNRIGIGSVVRVYPPGKLGQSNALLCAREIAVGYGYASGQEALAHIGLGDLDSCDIEVVLPHGKGRIERKGVKANQRLTIAK